MANDAIGFEVIINDELLNKVKQADGKLKQLQHTTEQVSKSMIESFKSIGARGLDELIGKVKILNTNIANTNLSNLGGGVTNLGQQATTSIEAIKQLIDSMSKLNQQKVQKLIDDAAYKRVKNDIQEVLVVEKQRKADSKLASEQITTANMRAIAQEKQKQIEIRKSLNEIKRLAKAYKDLPTTLNTKGAGNLVARSLQSTSINQRITSIKNLQNAIKDLDTTDKKYQQTVNKLNSEIARQKQELQKLGVSFNTVKQKSSNLLNISDQLQRRLALVFSISQINGYINRLVAVRGEFELQQRSLQAIIGNKDKANEVFDKVTKLAVQSPFQLKELVTYTKQLAAYKIETNKLYDSTKMLADISAGVGVEMSRMVLAYGQVASANYLRGTELRQFSEAGVNILGGLAEYFTELRGSVVEVDEVFDMVSRRMVRFEHVDEVLRRMTQSGGEFYNMQAIQAQTLKGQVSNLQDSLDIMLNEIGKANEGTLKFFVALTRDLVENWRVLEVVMTDVGVAIAGLGIMKFIESVNLMRSGIEAAALGGNRLAKVLIKLRDAFKSLWALITLNPLTIATGIIAVIGAITYAVYKYNKAVDEQNKKYDENAQRLQRMLYNARGLSEQYQNSSKSVKELNQKLKETKIGSDEYLETQKELLKAQQDQSKAILKLKSEYPELYAKIKDNIDSTDAWAEAMEELNNKTNTQIYLQQKLKGGLFQDDSETNIRQAIEAATEYELSLFNLRKKAGDLAVELKLAYKDGKISLEQFNKANEVFYKFNTAKSVEELEKLKQEFFSFFSATKASERFGLADNIRFFFENAITQVNIANKNMQTALDDFGGNMENAKDIIMLEWEENKLNFNLDSENEELKKNGEKLAVEYILGVIDGFEKEDARIREYAGKKLQEWFGTKLDLGIEIYTNDNQMQQWVARVKQPISDALEEMPKDIEYLKELFGDVSFQISPPNNTEDYQEYYKKVKQWLERIKEVINRAENDTDVLISPEEEKTLNRVKGIATEIAKILGMDFSFGKKGGDNSMLEERLRVLREMYDAYRDLNKTLDETKSKEGVIAKYGDAFKQAFGVDLKDSIFDPSFFVNDDEYIKALDKLLNLTADAKEKLKVQLEKGRVEWDIILYEKIESDAKLKENVEKMFSDYSSSIELDKMDISPEFAKAFFDIDTTSLEDLKKKLQELQPKFTGKDQEKQYKEYLKKVEELEVKAQQERLKEYLKYTRNAIGERAKLKLEELQKLSDIEQTFNKAESDKNAQIAKLQKDKPSGYEEEIQQLQEEIKLLQSARQQAKDGLHEETETAIQKLEWEAFKSTETFASMFNDLDNVSSMALSRMIKNLNDYREEWTDLPLSEMKEVINLLDKMEEAQAQKDISANPFKFARDTKREIEEYGGVEKAEEDMLYQQQKQMNLQEEIAQLEYIVQLKNEGEDLDKAILEYESKYSTFLKNGQKTAKERLTNAKNEVKESQKREKTAKDIVKSEEKLKASYQKQAEYMGDSLDMAKDLYEAFSDLYEALGGDKDSPVAIFANMGMNMAETVVNTIMLQMQLAAATVQAEAMGVAMNSAMGIVGWIVMAIQLIVEGIKAIVAYNDNQLQAQIETWAEGVEHLQKEYEKLEKVIESAISFETYRDAFEEMQDNLQQQIKNTQAMIEAEREKKKTDDDQIKEWQEDIEEAQEQIKENMEQFYEDMGGFGSAENYKSAAEDFIDAWYNSFKETGNGLAGLEEQFKEVMDNLVKKQMLMKVGERMFKPLFDMVDKYIDNDGVMSTEEMADVNKKAQSVMIATNEALTKLADSLGIVSDLGTTELEGLSKSIQGVTEVTAQALEAILNSMRFYVIDNNKQLTEIAERVLNFENPQNPILAELKQQTEYIEEIRTFLNSVISRQGNPSIRVSM